MNFLKKNVKLILDNRHHNLVQIIKRENTISLKYRQNSEEFMKKVQFSELYSYFVHKFFT